MTGQEITEQVEELFEEAQTKRCSNRFNVIEQIAVEYQGRILTIINKYEE